MYKQKYLLLFHRKVKQNISKDHFSYRLRDNFAVFGYNNSITSLSRIFHSEIAVLLYSLLNINTVTTYWRILSSSLLSEAITFLLSSLKFGLK
jgi:hypothetical protein